MFTIRLRKGSKTGQKVGEFGKFATQAQALAQAQILADGQSWAPGIKVVVEKVRGAPATMKRAKNAGSRSRKNTTKFSPMGTKGGAFYARRASDSKIVKITSKLAMHLTGYVKGDPNKIGYLAAYWVPPEYVKAGEAKFRVERGWIKPMWTWDGLHRGGVTLGDDVVREQENARRTNTLRTSGSSWFKGHQIRRSAAGYTVLPYGHVFPTLKAARAWLTQHVATASRQNPKGGRVLASWGKRVARTNRRSIATTQSVLFPVNRFTVEQARTWLRKHGKNDGVAVDSTADFHRFRQADPGAFQAGSFRTISLGRSGVKAIIGRPL